MKKFKHESGLKKKNRSKIMITFIIVLTMLFGTCLSALADDTENSNSLLSSSIDQSEEDSSYVPLSEAQTDFCNQVDNLDRESIIQSVFDYKNAVTASSQDLVSQSENAMDSAFQLVYAADDKYTLLSDDEKADERVAVAYSQLQQIFIDGDAAMGTDPVTYASTGVTVSTTSVTTIDLSQITGDVTIKNDGLYIGSVHQDSSLNPNGYRFTGTMTSARNYNIVVNSGVGTESKPVQLYLNNVTMNILRDYNYETGRVGSAICTTGSNTIITMEGSNALNYGFVKHNSYNCNNFSAGCCLEKSGMTGSLVLNGSGSLETKILTTNGIGNHAGSIGSSIWASWGLGKLTIGGGFCNFTIDGCTVNAYAGVHCPAIGSMCAAESFGQSNTYVADDEKYLRSSDYINPVKQICTNIVITNGAHVNAVGGDKCAGIGSGFGTPVSNITISNGAIVNSKGGDYSPGIGSGGTGTEKGSLYSTDDLFDVSNIVITGDSTVVTAIGDEGTNVPGIGCGISVSGYHTGSLLNVNETPDTNWQGYVKLGTSATNYSFTDFTPSPQNVTEEFGTTLQKAADDNKPVYYIQVYFSPYNDHNEIGANVSIGANELTSRTGGNAYTVEQLKSILLVDGKDVNGQLIPLSSYNYNQDQFNAINAAKTAGATGDYQINFTYTGKDSPSATTDTTFNLTTYVHLRGNGIDTQSASKSDIYASVAANDAVSRTGGDSFTGNQVLKLMRAAGNAEIRTLNGEDSGKWQLGICTSDDGTTDGNISIDQDDLFALNTAKRNGEIGTYPIRFYYTDENQVKHTVTANFFLTTNGYDAQTFEITETNNIEDSKVNRCGYIFQPMIGSNDNVFLTGNQSKTYKDLDNKTDKSSTTFTDDMLRSTVVTQNDWNSKEQTIGTDLHVFDENGTDLIYEDKDTANTRIDATASASSTGLIKAVTYSLGNGTNGKTLTDSDAAAEVGNKSDNANWPVTWTYTGTGGTYSTTSNVELYKYINLIYDKGDSTSGTVPEDTDNSYLVNSAAGTSTTVSDNTGSLMKEGYSFDGWYYKDTSNITTDYAVYSAIALTNSLAANDSKKNNDTRNQLYQVTLYPKFVQGKLTKEVYKEDDTTKITNSETAPGAVNQGDVIYYHLTVDNTGCNTALTGIKVSDVIPDGMTLVTDAANNTAGMNTAVSDGKTTVSWSDVSVAANSTTTLEFAVKVDSGVSFTNTANMVLPGQTTDISSNTCYLKMDKFDVTLGKEVDGTYADRTEDFTFTLQFKENDDNATLAAGTQISYTGGTILGVVGGNTKPLDGTLTLNADGKATVTLKHGQTITLKGVSAGLNVYVTENDPGSQWSTVQSKIDSGAYTTITKSENGYASAAIPVTDNKMITYKNIYQSIVPTNASLGGSNTNSLPILIGIAMAAIAGSAAIYLALQKQNGKER